MRNVRNEAITTNINDAPIDARSEKSLTGVHPDLVRVIRVAWNMKPKSFVVTQGLRTLQEQRKLVTAGASKTMKSRHLTGHAVDVMALVGGKGRWDWPLYPIIATNIKEAAALLNVPIIWGGDWKTFKDGPHFELDRKVYP